MLFQRAIAQASRGEFLTLARETYFSLGQDPDTLEAIFDPSWSDAMYYAVDCMDYAYGSGSAAEPRRPSGSPTARPTTSPITGSAASSTATCHAPTGRPIRRTTTDRTT